MGLDCEIYKCTLTPNEDMLDSTSIWCGRKTFDIHRWMQKYFDVHEEIFYIECLPITQHTLEALQGDLEAGLLLSGYVYPEGYEAATAEITEKVVEIIRVSRIALAEGRDVVYTSVA